MTMTLAAAMRQVSLKANIVDLELFLDGGELDIEGEDCYDEQYISDFNIDGEQKIQDSVIASEGGLEIAGQGVGRPPQPRAPARAAGGASKG